MYVCTCVLSNHEWHLNYEKDKCKDDFLCPLCPEIFWIYRTVLIGEMSHNWHADCMCKLYFWKHFVIRICHNLKWRHFFLRFWFFLLMIISHMIKFGNSRAHEKPHICSLSSLLLSITFSSNTAAEQFNHLLHKPRFRKKKSYVMFIVYVPSKFLDFHCWSSTIKDLCWYRSSFHDDRSDSKSAWRLTAFFRCIEL